MMHQLRVRASDRWKTSFRSQLGQFEWNVVPFGLQGSSSLLMRVMNEALTVGLGPSPAVRGCMPGRQIPVASSLLIYLNPLRPARPSGPTGPPAAHYDGAPMVCDPSLFESIE